MAKSILYLLFGLGKLPADLLPAFRQEGIILVDEGLKGSVLYRNFRAKGRYHHYKKSFFTGSLVITQCRFAAFVYSRPVINVPVTDDRLNQMDIETANATTLLVRFDAGLFHQGWKGTVECRFSTPSAPLFYAGLRFPEQAT